MSLVTRINPHSPTLIRLRGAPVPTTVVLHPNVARFFPSMPEPPARARVS